MEKNDILMGIAILVPGIMALIFGLFAIINMFSSNLLRMFMFIAFGQSMMFIMILNYFRLEKAFSKEKA